MFPFSLPPLVWHWELKGWRQHRLIHTVLFFQFDKSYAVHQIKPNTQEHLQELGWWKSVGFTSTFCLILHKNDIFYCCTEFFYDDSLSIVPHNAINKTRSIRIGPAPSCWRNTLTWDSEHQYYYLKSCSSVLSLYPLFYQLLLGYLAC